MKTGQRTRKDWLRDEYSNLGHLEDEGIERLAEKALRKENELIWAHYRDPDTDLTQKEARDRAQRRDYGRWNVSQSSLSRKIKSLDDTLLTEPIISLNMGLSQPEVPDHDGGLLDREGFEFRAKHNPESLDMLRESIARLLVDKHAIQQFRRTEKRTPEWAQDRFPDADPDMGLQEYEAREHSDPNIDPHEPHNP